ncbi:MAG TPA: HEAT repeat domain-containing protein [Planctomycetota bacterium]|nr:HEAT repeat domain-containing protein [Planctomycetota bacterium]
MTSTTRAGIFLLVLAAGSHALADDAARTRERSEKWVSSLTKRDAVERFLAGWNLMSLAPGSTDAILARWDAGKLANDSLVTASQALGETGAAKAVEPLAKIARDERQPSDVRVAALIAIAKIGGKDGTSALTTIASTDAGVAGTGEILRCAALIALGMRGDPVEAKVIESALASQDPELRRSAFRAIGFLRAQAFLPRCVKGLEDEHPLVVAEAALALARMGDTTSAAKIEAVRAKATNPGLRFLLLQPLALLEKKAATDELLADLEDAGSQLQSNAATILIELAEKRAIAPLRALLKKALEGVKVEAGADVRAAYGLGVFKDKEAVALLVRALEKGSVELRREAAGALGSIGAREGVAALEATARGNDRVLRSLAVAALGDIADPASGNDIAAALESPDPVTRYSACIALGLLGNKKAAPLLKAMASDDHDFVSAAASESLARLEGRAVGGDARDPTTLKRLRSLEREYLLRAQLGRLFESYAALSARISKDGPADVYARIIVGYYVDT